MLFAGKRDRAQPWTRHYNPNATEDDILACFRLLLGRFPNEEEWRGHRARAGETLRGVVTSYLNSLEFTELGLLAPPDAGGLRLSELPEFRIFTAVDDPAVGRPVHDNAYEPEVTAVFRRLLRPGMGVVDIGANIGYFSMLSAALVGPTGRVTAVEPNPRNARLLEASRRANGFSAITVVQAAAGPETGMLALHTSFSNGTTSPVPEALEMLLDSTTTVACLRLDDVVAADPPPALIKVDVEGAEYRALLGCTGLIRAHRPAIVSEFSPTLMPGLSGIDGPAYLRWLQDAGYALSVIALDGSTVPATIDAVMREHASRHADHIDLLAQPVA